MRLGIEPLVAGLAAQRAKAGDVARLEKNLRAVPGVPGSDEYVAWNVDFHRVLAKAAHNPMYEILINILMDFTEEMILKLKPSERVLHDTTSHPEFLEIVRRRDAKRATEKMRSHLRDIVPILEELEKKSGIPG